MATSAHHPTQDQNLNISSHNGSTPARKTNFRKVDKKGGFNSRKALNDISNSRNPLIREPAKKTNFANVIIPIDKIPSTPGTTKLSTRVPEKKKIASRKPLIDVTNSAEPCLHQHHKTKSADGCAVTASILDERYLHDHQQCIKSLNQTVDKDYFLTSVGLSNADARMELPAMDEVCLTHLKLEANNLKIKEIPEPVDVLYRTCDKKISLDQTSPSIKSPPPLYTMMNNNEDELFDLMSTALAKLE